MVSLDSSWKSVCSSGLAEAPPASAIEPAIANPAASPSVRATLVFPPRNRGSVHPRTRLAIRHRPPHRTSVLEPRSVNCQFGQTRGLRNSSISLVA